MHHISTDELELFLAGEITDAVAVVRIEQHVRVCQECADRVVALEHFLKLMRTGLLPEAR